MCNGRKGGCQKQSNNLQAVREFVEMPAVSSINQLLILLAYHDYFIEKYHKAQKGKTECCARMWEFYKLAK